MILGIMGAMPDEVDQLCAKLENVTVELYGGVEYHKGTLAGKQVVVCCAGMGKANAAATTQVLITKFGAEKIIFSGIAGNMTSKNGIGAEVIDKILNEDLKAEMLDFLPLRHTKATYGSTRLGRVGAYGLKARICLNWGFFEEAAKYADKALTLAKEAGADILPVVLDGTKTLIKKNLAFNWGNRITVRVLSPVPAERVAALETHERMQEVHERMCTALGEVRIEKLKVKDQK